MANDTMTIREMCEAFKVTARTLRFYETKELLSPIRIGQRRLFTKRDRARLRLILKGKQYGFSLEELRQILDLYETENGPERQLALAVQTGRAHLAEMMNERERLERTIADLSEDLDCAERQLSGMRPAAMHA